MNQAVILSTFVASMFYVGIGHGQVKQNGPEQSGYEYELERFRSWAIVEDVAPLTLTQNPERQKFVDIAEHAQRRIFTTDNNELRKMAREFEAKLLEIQTSDVGRWVATQPEMVTTFLSLDGEVLLLSDAALDIRRKRLQAGIDALNRYTPETQGKFDPSTNPAVETILQDANWIEENFGKLSSRLALLADLENSFPANEDWSSFPSLTQQKQKRKAELFTRDTSAAEKGRQDAIIQGADVKEQSAFDIEMQRTKTHVQGQERLAAVQRQFMMTEFGKKEAELESRIRDTELETEKLKSDMVNRSAAADKQRIIEYVSSSRVQNLLAPFCSNGYAEAYTGAGQRRIEELTAGPMSFSRMARYGCLNANHRGMRSLLRIANSRGNDRPAWGATENDYAQAGDIFEDMEGQQVNPFIEAQRILREHTAVLLELGMLRD